MIFSISQDARSISKFDSSWSPKELDLEKYILGGVAADEGLLNASILGEQLLLVRNQASTFDKKRADILALDSQGNGVIVELKRDQGMAGVETQALQYLAAFAPFTGQAFVDKFARDPKSLSDRIGGFLGAVPIEKVNLRHRIILVARSFDRTLYSMGKWFGSNGVAFRCIEYTPFEVGNQKFLSFSVAFDQSPPEIFPISLVNPLREAQTFWHNIGAPDPAWWAYLIAHGELPASWDNEIGDDGWQLLKSYVRGDRIIAYAKGYGAIGWGIIQRTDYKLVERGSTEDRMNGELRHRLSIQWKVVTKDLALAISPAQLRAFGLYHPISTSVRIDAQKAGLLIDLMNSTLDAV